MQCSGMLDLWFYLFLLFCLEGQRVRLSGRQASNGASDHAHVRGIGAGNTCGKKTADLAAVVAAAAAVKTAARRPNSRCRPFKLGAPPSRPTLKINTPPYKINRLEKCVKMCLPKIYHATLSVYSPQ